MIGKNGDNESAKSVLAARHDDDDNIFVGVSSFFGIDDPHYAKPILTNGKYRLFCL